VTRMLFAVTMALLLTGCPHSDGPSQLDQAISSMSRITRKECGVTWSLTTGNEARSGVYVTGAFPEAGEVQSEFPDEQKIRTFIARNSDLVTRRENVVGTWCVTAKGDCHAPGAVTCYLDISRETATLDEAARLATACNQISIAHLKRDGRVEIIDSYEGHHFGDGKPISGAALKACRKARGEP
jgi:hypothetical protein